MSGLEWSDLKYFLAALEAGTLSGAAEQLGVAQATMSRRVAGLEEQIGHALFDRSRGGLTPTEAAVLLRPHAEAMAEAAEAATAALSGLEVRPAGTVRLAVAPGIAVDLGPLLVRRLQPLAPDLRLEVLADNRYVDLARREAEIAIRARPPEQGDLVYRRLPAVALAPFVSPDYARQLRARAGGDVRPEDVDWIQYSAELLQIPLAQWVERVRGDRPPAYTSNNFLAMRAAAAAGLGAMLLPIPQGRAAGLVPLDEIVVELPTVHWYLVVHRALRRVPRIVVVLDLLDELIREVSGGAWPLLRGEHAEA
jgi:DNA-binding transcriptional LysR family regulator